MAERDYAAACRLAAEHKLHSRFAVDEFVVPLIIDGGGGNLGDVEVYMREADAEQKLALVLWLDGLMATGGNLCEDVEKLSIEEGKEQLLSGKPLMVILLVLQ